MIDILKRLTRYLAHPCLLGHAPPMFHFADNRLKWQCERCLAELGDVLGEDIPGLPRLRLKVEPAKAKPRPKPRKPQPRKPSK